MKFFLPFILVCVICFSSCKNDKKEIKPIQTNFTKEGELTLFKSTSDSIITVFNLEIADTDYDIQTGLMYRETMEDNQAMLFVFPRMRQRSFYMKNTRFPLDLIFLDDKQYIVSFQENAQPLNEASLASKVPAQYVLEIKAGLAEKWLLEIGDRMEYTNFSNN